MVVILLKILAGFGYCAACKRAIREGEAIAQPMTPSGVVSIHMDCMVNGKRRAPDMGEDAQVSQIPTRDNSQHETPDIA